METLIRNDVDLGEFVRAARLTVGLTQAELAARAKVGRQWLVGLETGMRPGAPLNMVMRVLAILESRPTLAPTPEWFGLERLDRP
ncbi:MAG: helix-turn-helix domain-containing protein [Propionibacteriaceae bacterium]|jgi:HTH-type transcriptional regulator/antitoxin HipB|nr:helix-turn-helix domain-containing protein [Propionibacteriaceae bacterium]